MTLKVWDYTNPLEYTYDSSKIVLIGGIAKLAYIDIYSGWHFNETSGTIVQDFSGNDRNGNTVGTPSWVSGKLNNCIQLNGTSQYINCGNIADFERTKSFSVECWIKTSRTSAQTIISKMTSTSPYIGWRITTAASKIYITLYGNSTVLQLHSNTIVCDDNWHHIVMTYNGSSLASGVKIYIDSVLQTNAIDNNNLTTSILTTAQCNIGSTDNGSAKYQGLIDSMVIYEKILSQSEVDFKYNSGSGTEEQISTYPTDKPSIQPSSLLSTIYLYSLNTWSEILGAFNQGSIKYILSQDGITWYYWNGSSWTTGGDSTNCNTVAEINANIGSFPITGENFTFKAFLISNGLQRVELDSNTLSYTANQPPLVDAGTDKSCSDGQTINPFSDAVFSDPDGDIEFAYAYYNIESSGWIEILKGSYPTLQEAVRAFTYRFDNIGSIQCQLKIEDEVGAETVDSCLITVAKYNVTFNVKDEEGYDITGLVVNFSDGTGNHYVNSPFNYSFETGIFEVAFYSYYGLDPTYISINPETTPIINITMENLNKKILRYIRELL